MARKSLLILLLCLSFASTVVFTQAQSIDPAPALNAVLADLSQQVGRRVTLDQLSRYSYAELLYASGTAECLQAAALYPTGSEHAMYVSISYHGMVYRYFTGMNGGIVIRCSTVAATLMSTLTATVVPPTAQPTVAPTATVPSTPTAVPTLALCNPALPNRLVIGGHGRVTSGDPSNLREAPSATGIRIRQIYHAVIFTVLAGPVCDALGRPWFQIKYNDSIGWAAGGDNSSYFLEPAP